MTEKKTGNGGVCVSACLCVCVWILPELISECVV